MLRDFMRLIVFFDLPTITKAERDIYRRFHKYLLEEGYIMMQYSIYIKIFTNRDSCVKHKEVLRRYLPKQGQIRIMMITEKQYANMEIVVGGASRQELASNINSFISL